MMLRRRQTARLREAIAAVPLWWHSIDFGNGVVAPGHKSPEILTREWGSLGLESLQGLSVLDIGAWDGFFSFSAERAGAARVVALDYYAWGATRQNAHIRGQEGAGGSEFKLDALPGRAGFDLARRELGSSVEPVVADFLEVGPAEIGIFDVVLFLGVLYHLEDPLGALRHLRTLARSTLIVETAAIAMPDDPSASLWEFYPADELHGDPTNWWAPTPAALTGACRAAGFSRAASLVAPPEPQPKQSGPTRFRAVVRADV
jgi:tRNA (mo5U34)-methyltransferase